MLKLEKSKCRQCGGVVVNAMTETGKAVPMEEQEKGSHYLVEGAGLPIIRRAFPGHPDVKVQLYDEHAEHCPKSDRLKRRAKGSRQEEAA